MVIRPPPTRKKKYVIILSPMVKGEGGRRDGELLDQFDGFPKVFQILRSKTARWQRTNGLLDDNQISEKSPRPLKIKLALPPPPSKRPQHPPKNEEFLILWGFPAERTKKCQAPHKIGAAISGPRIARGNFMDITFF